MSMGNRQIDEYTLRDTNSSVVNAFRRTMLSDVNEAAIPNKHYDPEHKLEGGVQIIENTGRLHNEIMIHRLSLVPLPSFITTENAHLYKIHINVTADCDVDLTTKNYTFEKEKETPEEKYELFDNDILITKLFQGERFKAILYPTVGIPSNACSEDEETASANNRRITGYASFDIASIATSAPEETPDETPDDETTPTSFKFHIKSIGRHSNEKIVEKTTDALIYKLNSVKHMFDDKTHMKEFYLEDTLAIEHKSGTNDLNIIDNTRYGSYIWEEGDNVYMKNIPWRREFIKDEAFTKKQISNTHVLYKVSIPNEDHTIGCILQNFIHEQKKTDFVAYKKEHPLDKHIVLHVAVETTKSISDIRDLIKKSVDNAIYHVNKQKFIPTDSSEQSS